MDLRKQNAWQVSLPEVTPSASHELVRLVSVLGRLLPVGEVGPTSTLTSDDLSYVNNTSIPFTFLLSVTDSSLDVDSMSLEQTKK